MENESEYLPELSLKIDEVVKILDIVVSPEFEAILSARLAALTQRISQYAPKAAPRPDDAAWEVIRKAVLKRDRHQCALGLTTDRPLHVHHLIPVAKGGKTIPENLLALCDDCHGKIHPWSGGE